MTAFEPNGLTIVVRTKAGHTVATFALPIDLDALEPLLSALAAVYGEDCIVRGGGSNLTIAGAV